MVDNDADIDPTKPLLTEWLAELCSGRRVVVFGCGDGAVAAGIAARAHVVVAFDPNPDQAAATRSHWRGLTNLFVGAGAPGRVDLSAHAPELVVDLSGPVGGEDLQRLVASASPILGEGGILVVEVAEAEADSVQTSFRHLRSVRVWVHQASVIGEEPMPAISLEEAAPTRILQVASNQPIPALPSSSNLEPVAASAAADLARIERLERELREARRRYDRLRSRRLVRASLALASVARPAVELARRFRTNPTDGGTGSEAPSESPLRTRAEVEHGIRRLRPGAGPTEGPLVSLVVLTRDGRHHLERLFAGLENSTAYRSFEVVVVDNASSDGTDELLARRWTFPVRVL
ncbi:MAG: glycosyltransferase family 2 protein, partial [Acidimicrobiia bacterium]